MEIQLLLLRLEAVAHKKAGPLTSLLNLRVSGLIYIGCGML